MDQPITMPWSAPMLPPPPHAWEGVRSVVFPFQPRAEAVATVLPPGIEAADGPGLVVLLDYPQTEIVHPFNECVITLPVRVGSVEGNYVPYIYVTTDEALIGGREFAGFPKKLAQIAWARTGDEFAASVSRWGETLITLEGKLSGPMPQELAEAQAQASRRPSINYKLIPGPGGEIEIEEITAVNIDIAVRSAELGTGRLESGGSQFDPIADLVPTTDGMLAALYSDNTIPAGEVLERIDRRVRV